MKKCWANTIGQCGNKLTGEHLISNAILDKKIVVQGFSWCKDSPKEIGSASLVNNFLCNIHNNALSPCDNEIKNFVSSVENFIKTEQRFTKYGFSMKKVPVTFKVNGKLLEKWFVKTLINITLTNEKNVKIPFDKILPILFSENNIFEKPYGINFAIRINQAIEIRNEISVQPLFNENELFGGLFKFKGFKIIVLLPCSKPPIHNDILKIPITAEDFSNLQLNWHNEEINMSMLKGRKSVKVLSLKINWT